MDGGEDAITMLAKGARQSDEGPEPAAARPGEPGLEVRGRGRDGAVVERSELLLEQVGTVDGPVEVGDFGETGFFLRAEVLGSFEQGPSGALERRRVRRSAVVAGLGAPQFVDGIVGQLDDVEGSKAITAWGAFARTSSM